MYALSNEPVDGIDPNSIQPTQQSKPVETKQSETTTTTTTQTPETKTVAPATAPSASSISTTVSSKSHRVPMIRFRYGVRGKCFIHYFLSLHIDQ